MNTMADRAPTQTLHDEQFRYLLDVVATQVAYDAACVCVYNAASNRLDPVVERGITRDDHRRMLMASRDVVAGLKPDTRPMVVSPDLLDGTPFQSALFLPLSTTEHFHGALTLFAFAPDAYTLADADALTMPAYLIGTLLENEYLHRVRAENFAAAQSILVTAQAIADSPSPQHIVDIVHETLFDEHITTCALLLYGPVRELNTASDFEYLEIKGTWSKRLGSGVGIGVKLYLKDYSDVMTLLEQRGVLVYQRGAQLRRRVDPLTRGFMRAERMRSIMLLSLQSAHRKLGVMVIATDRPHIFTPQEIHSYRTVSEFLAISAMAQMLQQETTLVQQGRAALLDAVTDGVVMVLPNGQGGHVLTVNHRFTNLFSVPESDAQGLALNQLIDRMQVSEGLRDELRSTWLSTPVRDPSMLKGEFHMKNEDGAPLDIEWYSAPVYQEGHVLGRIYIFHDVTAERTAQRLRAGFLSRVSHELRTPLTSIRGFAEFILEVSGDQLPDLAREYTEIILNSAKHLNRVFTDMIEMTRADAGELKLHKTDAHLPDIIIDVASRLEMQYKGRNQTLILELDDDLPTVNADVDRIMQVTTNLLTNAIKYSPEGGKITISTEYIESAKQLPKGTPQDVLLPALLVKVSDEGAGLSADDADKVFMPFHRTDAAKAKKIEGVGLGLAVTRSIVEVHRGKIWAVPKGRGVRGGLFMFTLPVKMPTA